MSQLIYFWWALIIRECKFKTVFSLLYRFWSISKEKISRSESESKTNSKQRHWCFIEGEYSYVIFIMFIDYCWVVFLLYVSHPIHFFTCYSICLQSDSVSLDQFKERERDYLKRRIASDENRCVVLTVNRNTNVSCVLRCYLLTETPKTSIIYG